MANETFKDHFSAHANRYAEARPGYPGALFEWLAAQCRERALAWDCATGSGQAAVELARHFERVVATDASAEQIANARQAANIAYCVAPAENCGLDDASIDLVTVAQALHWFDRDAFYAQARRVLKPGGVIVAWGYHLTRVQPAIDRIINVFDQAIIGPFWPPERRHIDARYGDLDFPFARIAVPDFDMHLAWSRKQFLDYIATWSAVQRYRKQKGHDPMAWLENEIAAYWNPDEVLDVSWPMFFLAGRP
ncbi:MAG TPA: class I SAM-dependent methyltransferase [Gammaproteobacteria bacterium]